MPLPDEAHRHSGTRSDGQKARLAAQAAFFRIVHRPSAPDLARGGTRPFDGSLTDVSANGKTVQKMQPSVGVTGHKFQDIYADFPRGTWRPEHNQMLSRRKDHLLKIEYESRLKNLQQLYPAPKPQPRPWSSRFEELAKPRRPQSAPAPTSRPETFKAKAAPSSTRQQPKLALKVPLAAKPGSAQAAHRKQPQAAPKGWTTSAPRGKEGHKQKPEPRQVPDLQEVLQQSEEYPDEYDSDSCDEEDSELTEAMDSTSAMQLDRTADPHEDAAEAVTPPADQSEKTPDPRETAMEEVEPGVTVSRLPDEAMLPTNDAQVDDDDREAEISLLGACLREHASQDEGELAKSQHDEKRMKQAQSQDDWHDDGCDQQEDEQDVAHGVEEGALRGGNQEDFETLLQNVDGADGGEGVQREAPPDEMEDFEALWHQVEGPVRAPSQEVHLDKVDDADSQEPNDAGKQTSDAIEKESQPDDDEDFEKLWRMADEEVAEPSRQKGDQETIAEVGGNVQEAMWQEAKEGDTDANEDQKCTQEPAHGIEKGSDQEEQAAQSQEDHRQEEDKEEEEQDEATAEEDFLAAWRCLSSEDLGQKPKEAVQEGSQAVAVVESPLENPDQQPQHTVPSAGSVPEPEDSEESEASVEHFTGGSCLEEHPEKEAGGDKSSHATPNQRLASETPGSLHAVEQSSQNFAHTKSDVEADASPVAGRTGYLSEPEESEESDASVEHFAAPSEEHTEVENRARGAETALEVSQSFSSPAEEVTPLYGGPAPACRSAEDPVAASAGDFAQDDAVASPSAPLRSSSGNRHDSSDDELTQSEVRPPAETDPQSLDPTPIKRCLLSEYHESEPATPGPPGLSSLACSASTPHGPNATGELTNDFFSPSCASVAPLVFTPCLDTQPASPSGLNEGDSWVADDEAKGTNDVDPAQLSQVVVPAAEADLVQAVHRPRTDRLHAATTSEAIGLADPSKDLQAEQTAAAGYSSALPAEVERAPSSFASFPGKSGASSVPVDANMRRGRRRSSERERGRAIGPPPVTASRTPSMPSSAGDPPADAQRRRSPAPGTASMPVAGLRQTGENLLEPLDRAASDAPRGRKTLVRTQSNHQLLERQTQARAGLQAAVQKKKTVDKTDTDAVLRVKKELDDALQAVRDCEQAVQSASLRDHAEVARIQSSNGSSPVSVRTTDSTQRQATPMRHAS